MIIIFEDRLIKMHLVYFSLSVGMFSQLIVRQKELSEIKIFRKQTFAEQFVFNLSARTEIFWQKITSYMVWYGQYNE